MKSLFCSKFSSLRERLALLLLLFVFALHFSSCTKEPESLQTDTGRKNFYSNVVYGNNLNWLGQNEQLTMDVYLPYSAVFTDKKFPFIMFVHGGGFYKGDKSSGAVFAMNLANKGFVVASINYRLGWMFDSSNICNGDTLEGKKAVYRALQDTRAAWRFVVANADRFAIDTSWMFQSGNSAGAVTTLYLPLINDQNVNSVFPGFESSLGSLDDADNNLNNKFTVKALIDSWGAISDINLITSQNALPTLIFHGYLDDVCPYGVGHYYSCPNFPVSYGAKPIYDRLHSLGVPVVANIDLSGGHESYDDTFRAENTVCFLRALMAGQPQHGFYTDNMGNCR